ncbi:MAG TPA: hypothetical protein PKH24_12475 [Sedimentisphaerales bacterium]|jgi:hypothetical protein|nr:hypothetical protein [Sedimentisphaerales bacterium]HNU30808.1 hypothetical protein [Sedimentisphaerales bacterium]
MSGQARVDSFGALRQFRASLATFASVASVALDEASTDIQRTLLWLREDRNRYWKQQVQTRSQQYTQARLALKQHEVLDRAIAGTHSSCVEERRALRIAERRLRDAENTFRLVRIYSTQIERESLDYKGAIHGLVNAIEVEIPNACASLDRMVDSLEQYVTLAPPEAPGIAREGIEDTVLQPADVPTPEENRTEKPQEGEDMAEPERASE